MQVRLYDTMLLALAIKQAGGTLLIEKKTFEEINDDFEIMTTKNMEGNAVLTLVEEEELVTKIRIERAAEEAKKAHRRQLIVPR
jgi:hypothetical protein